MEFAIRYAQENADNFLGPFNNYPVSFGNGAFTVMYTAGCPDMLFSTGTCGTAKRKVELKNFSSFLGRSLYLSDSTVISPSHYSSANGTYWGDRIEFRFCDPSLLQPGALGQSSIVVRDSITIAATIPVNYLRVGLMWQGGMNLTGYGMQRAATVFQGA